MRPIENFCVVEGGLNFVYNEYEVACYAAGAIEVVVSFDEIRNLGGKVVDVSALSFAADKEDIDGRFFLGGFITERY